MFGKVLLSIGTAWIICFILTVTGVLSEDSAARTDKNLEILTDAPWFRVPYPGNCIASSIDDAQKWKSKIENHFKLIFSFSF